MTETEQPRTLTFSEKPNTQYCIPEWLRDEQIRIAIQKIKGRIVPNDSIREEPIAVIGYGPSLKETWEEIRDFKFIITCSGAHKFLIERGIVPTWHLEVDPREHKIQLLGPANKDVIYLPSSTSHPKYLDHLLASGADIKLWHVFTNQAEGQRILPAGEWSITGGADAGLRALVMSRLLGFVNIHAFGIDGSFGDGTSHADAHPNAPNKNFKCEFPEGSGIFYQTTPALLGCAKSVPHEVDQLKDAAVQFHGSGLIQSIMQAHTPRKPNQSMIAFVKPELISSGYQKLNEQLHMDNPAYGTSGRKHVDAVLRIAESLKTTSILDYGCGKGMLAKGIPFPIWEFDPCVEGKRDSPRPADIVVCTDVLEHVEPENLMAVLADLARVTAKVGYFVIHTGPSQKSMNDGRNTHLIQQPMEWWQKRLSKFFTIGRIFQQDQSIQAVVGPKVNETLKDVTKVEHDGTAVKFHTPNEQTLWRAKSLFTKEPATIAWIDTFKPGEILFDVGANVGGYSVWAAKRRGVKVLAFEPQADNYALLCRNLQLNGSEATAYCMALTKESSMSFLSMSQPEPGSACHTFGADIGPDLQPRNGVRQGCLGESLDSVAKRLGITPDHLKIDVDGFEHLVVAGADEILRSGKIKSLLVEVNGNLPEHGEMLSSLAGLSYEFEAAQVEASTRKEGAFKGCAEYVFRKKQEPIVNLPGTINEKPFPWFHSENAFSPDLFEEMRKKLPSDYTPIEKSRNLKGYPERFTAQPTDPFWTDLFSRLRDGRLKRALCDRFGVPNPDELTDECLLIRDLAGYQIGPHTDSPSKVITVLFYLPKDGLLVDAGTTIYTPKKMDFTCAGGPHYPFEDFDVYQTMPFKPNSMFAFLKTNNSFHGVPPCEGTRDVLLYDIRCVNK